MSECIEHTQKGNAGGYGNTTIKGRMCYLHRLAYAEHNGLDVFAMGDVVIRHTCDNPRCINPRHLLAGTQAQNMQDKVQRGRIPKGEAHKRAKLTDLQVGEIRRLYTLKENRPSQRTLAVQYGVSQRQILRIVNGTSRV